MVTPPEAAEQQEKEALRSWSSSKYAEPKPPKTFSYSQNVLECNSLVTYKGKLYAFLGPAGEIWEYDGSSWEKKYTYPEMVTESGKRYGWRAAAWDHVQFSADDCLYFSGIAPAKPDGQEGIIIKYDGESFTRIEPEISGEVFAIAEYKYGDALYGGADGGKLLKSSDGTTWSVKSTAPDGAKICGLIQYKEDNLLYVCTEDHIYSYDPGTDTWTAQVSGSYFRDIIQVGHSWYNEIWLVASGLSGEESTLFVYDGTSWTKVRLGKSRFGEVQRLYTSTVPDNYFGYNRVGTIYVIEGHRDGSIFSGESRIWATDLTDLRCLGEFPFMAVEMAEYNGRLAIGTAEHPTGKVWLGKRVNRRERWNTVTFLNTPLTPGEPVPKQHRLWNAKSISAGDSTDAVLVGGYGTKTVHFETDTAGTLSIEVSTDYGKSWNTLLTQSFGANEYNAVIPNGDFPLMRLSFDTAATVTGKVMLS